MKKLFCLLLLVALNASAAFNEFYCDNTAGACGSNVFSGSTSSTTPAFSSFSGNWNGTDTFTPTDGQTPSISVNVGDFASVYPDGEVVTKYIARVVTVNAGANGTIVLSTTAIAGTAPGSLTGTATIRVGGAWHGPGTRDQVGGQGGSTNYFPFDFVTTMLTNTSSQIPRVNFKSGTTYTVTNAITQSKTGPIIWQGYTSSADDGGKFVLDGGTSVGGYALLTVSGALNTFKDAIFAHNGGSGGAGSGLSFNGNRTTCINVVAHDFRGEGFIVGGAESCFIGCEAYACNSINTADKSGFESTQTQNSFIRCVSHDNVGSNSSGFQDSGGCSWINCIAYNNGKDGYFSVSAVIGSLFLGCDFYNNTTAGLRLAGTAGGGLNVQNCNFIKNGTFGITNTTLLRNGSIINCGFGSGTQANTAGDIATSGFSGNFAGGIYTNGNIIYASGATPWSDPVNGNFSITLAASKATGLGLFTLYTTNSPTVAFPDIGAAQASDTNSASSGGSYTFAQ